jgi:hypothetical protein
MKRIHAVVTVAILGTIAAVAYAAPDVEPFRSVHEPRLYKAVQQFEKDVNVTFLDAGTINTSGTFPLVKASVLDAGYGLINGTLQVDGNLILTASTTKTTCTLNAASPSVCTATVRAGSTCSCSPVGATAAIAAGGCAVGLSGTTLTVTAANGASHVVNIHCF